MNSLIIGFAGPAGAGKDTAAAYLRMAYGFKIVGFADPMRNAWRAMGLPMPKTVEEKQDKLPGFDFSYRDGMQKLGEEWGRQLDPNMWVKLAEDRIEGRTVFSDVRYPSEAAMIKSHGGIIVNIKGRGYKLGTEQVQHPSERGVVGHYDIKNTGKLDDFYTELHNLVTRLMELEYV